MADAEPTPEATPSPEAAASDAAEAVVEGVEGVAAEEEPGLAALLLIANLLRHVRKSYAQADTPTHRRRSPC